MMADRDHDTDRRPSGLARLLGWASLALGMVGVLAPARVARSIGVPATERTHTILRGVGVQELLMGLGLMRRGHPAWLWSRLSGDALHLGMLQVARRSWSERPERTAATMGAVAGIAALDLLASVRSAGGRTQPVATTAVVTVNRSPDEVYRAWRRLSELPRFMAHLESVETLEDRRSHWVARGPAGRTVEWDAEVVEDVPAERLAWRSLPGADVDNAGEVRFAPAPGNRGTEVTVELEYRAPGGRAGRRIARMLGEHPAQQAEDDLRRFKQLLETGEVARSSGTPDGSEARAQWQLEPAAPRG